ncbi:hypothetical protein STCU_08960 [Strigomonas culicis]|uniref:Xrn1 N-terminal domain-containing protein n=1 Tax=Strigomonas culicis TaxID=28005 RepID=S9VBT2_9TRYP|nr:hypothetical protein STCU_08960 [Strigomonas culicis]|eukprot:EPY20515.1 hypothetical protein STCU_08960 [Strigomonas culicis]
MGLLGLRKFIDSSGCTRLLPVPLSEEEAYEAKQRRLYYLNNDPVTDEEADAGDASDKGSSPRCVDHVLVDMNCIIHSCFGKAELSHKSKKELIQDILQRLKVLVTGVVVPTKTLTICLDGPAPLAKMQTQRLRRRKLSFLDSSNSVQNGQALSSLSITAGSLFLVEIENALAAQFKLNNGRGFLKRHCALYLHGSTVMGEGEAKVSRALSFIAGNYEYDPSLYAGSHGHAAGAPVPAYNPNDTISVIGNDIDLVLTCLGATFYHNINVIGPSSLQLINVSEILYRWLRATSTTQGESSKLTPQQLPSVRVDFIFIFLLNGGDHYVGAGEVAMTLWRRYRSVRAAYPQSTLVAPDLMSIDTDFLADIVDVKEYGGTAEEQIGLDLFQAALWSLYTVVTGVCPNYRYIPPTSQPTLSHLRAAAAHLQKKHKTLRLPFVVNSAPLSPLETYTALMPTEAALPRSVERTLHEAKHRALAQSLLSSNDPLDIAKCAAQAVEAAADALTPSERYLRQFTSPVWLNYQPPARRLSRHEQHRMLAKTGTITREDPVPEVRKLTIPERFTYVHFTYPRQVQELVFVDPFSHSPAAEGESGDQASEKARRIPLYEGGAAHDGSGVDRTTAKVEKLIERSKELSAKNSVRKKKLMESKKPEVHQKVIKKQEKEMRRIKRKLSQLKTTHATERLREVENELGHDALLNEEEGDDNGFLDEIKGFLGNDDQAFQAVLSSKNKNSNGTQKNGKKWKKKKK